MTPQQLSQELKETSATIAQKKDTLMITALELKCCQLIQGDLMAIKSAFCKTKGKPVFQVKIKQKNKVSKEAKAMIDSGADYSCFSEQWCRDHKIDI